MKKCVALYIAAILICSAYLQQAQGGLSSKPDNIGMTQLSPYVRGQINRSMTPGPQGPKGDQGEKGDAGEAGPAGSVGQQGLVGPKGEAGSTGPAGIQGPVGQQGERGLQGIQGVAGPAGTQGIQGTVGNTGATGATGPQGIQGPSGAAAAYSFAASTPSRALNTNFTPSATKAVFACYSIEITCSLSLAGSCSAKVELRSDTNATPTTVRGTVSNTLTLGLGVTIATTTGGAKQVCHIVPPGHVVRLASSGSVTPTIVSQSEVAL